MLKKVKQHFSNKFLKNVFSMSLLQVTNYVFPLLTFPYLVRILGPENFGKIAFAQAFIQYFVLITEYGFNLSATREVSIHRNDKQKLSEIFWNVFYIQFGLMILSFIFMMIIISFIPLFFKEKILYLYTFGIVVGTVFSTNWFFQGVEDMKYITTFGVISKVIFTVLIFVCISNSEQYKYVALFSSFGVIASSLFSIVYAFKRYSLKICSPKREILSYYLYDGFNIFISKIAINIYTASNTFVLGLFAPATEVAYFSAADKIRSAVQVMFQPLSQSLYPKSAQLFNISVRDGYSFLQKLLKIILPLSFISSLLLFTFADSIVKLVLGNYFIHSAKILKILAFLPFIVAISNVFGVQGLLNINAKKEFSIVVTLGAILNFGLAFILCRKYLSNGLALSILVTEFFISISMVSIFNYKDKTYE